MKHSRIGYFSFSFVNERVSCIRVMKIIGNDAQALNDNNEDFGMCCLGFICIRFITGVCDQ